MTLNELIKELIDLQAYGNGNVEVCSWAGTQILPVDSPAVVYKQKGQRDRLWGMAMDASARGKKIILL